MISNEDSYPFVFLSPIATMWDELSFNALGIFAKAISHTCGKALTENFLELSMVNEKFSKEDLAIALEEIIRKKLVIKFPVEPENTLDGSKNVYLFFQFPLTVAEEESFYKGRK